MKVVLAAFGHDVMGGNDGESLSCRSEALYIRCFTCLCSRCREGLREGGYEESLSEVAEKGARLEAPRPLKGSSRCRRRARPTEWLLRGESDRAAINLRLFRVVIMHFTAPGRK